MGTFASTERGPDPLRPAPSGPALLPVGFGLVADRDLRVLADGRALLGGSPTRLVRLRPRAADMARRWLNGEPVENRRADRTVARRLVASGVLHPRPPAMSPGVLVTVVVPVRDRPEHLTRLLRSLGDSPCIVVDDCSAQKDAIEKAARDAGAEYLRLDTHSGPAAARNAGMRRVLSPLVAFVDSDCTVPPGWLNRLVGHFADPRVAMVAPRVVTPSGPSCLARYEAARSPLDLGAAEGKVTPGARVSYVPSAAMVVRRAAVARSCFDERLEVGEDVDLVWRLVEAGWDVRYVPNVEVTHEADLRPARWLARRALYGSTAGPLARRHQGSLAPARVSPVTAATWGLLIARRPVAAVAVAGVSTAMLASRLSGVVDDPFVEATRLSLSATARSAAPALAGFARAWGPALLMSLFVRRSGRFRWAAGGALVIAATRDWRSRPAELGPFRYLAVRVADDLAYGTGLWWGCWRARTVRPLIPSITSARRRARSKTPRPHDG
jgi:mycofactocin system glycosyltransferase